MTFSISDIFYYLVQGALIGIVIAAFLKEKRVGYYINPQTQTKEQWLNDHGTLVPYGTDIELLVKPAGTYLVCWVDNGSFTAAGICFDDLERDAFNAGFKPGAHFPDQRPHTWFLCTREDLILICPAVEKALK